MRHLTSAFRYNIKKIMAIIALANMVFLTGCQIQSDSDLYNQIKNQTEMFSDNTQVARENSVVYFAEIAYNFCNNLKSIAPFVIIGSICIGLILLRVIQEDQAVRKKALFLFVITIPLIMFLATYALSWFVGTFI